MERRNLWAVVFLLLAGLSLSACGAALRASPDAPQTTAPANVERIDGTDVSRVKLIPKAAERMGIKTVAVREQGTGSASAAPHKIVPYAAVLYDSDNKTWVYTNPQPLVYVRHRISVDHISGDDAVLTDGPLPGTVIVSVGAAELFGIEFEHRR